MTEAERTRIVHLREGRRDRKEAPNNATLIADAVDLPSPPSFKDIFLQHYETIHDLSTSYQRPGVAIIAIDGFLRCVAGGMCLAAKPGEANAAIIGRHSVAELFLQSDPNLSLRHLALVLHPHVGGEDLRFRVLDLRTPLSFMDEHGRRLEALISEGPVFIRCGRYLLLLLTTGEGIDWPDDPEQGWQCIPERVYFDETTAEPDRWQRRRKAPQAGKKPIGHQTRIQTIRGPSRAGRDLLAVGERIRGVVKLRTPAGDSHTLPLGRRALREGVLLGRYHRCDGDGAVMLTDENISRVHLLLLGIDDGIYVVDTASTNGTWIPAEKNTKRKELRITRLDPDREIMIGDKVAYLRWTPT